MELGSCVDLSALPLAGDNEVGSEFAITNEERKAAYRRKRSNRYSSSVYSFPNRLQREPVMAQPYFQD